MTDQMRELLTEIVYYVRKAEEQIDSEWGMVRNWKKLKEDNELPAFYWTVVDMLGGEPAEKRKK